MDTDNIYPWDIVRYGEAPVAIMTVNIPGT